MRFCVALGFAIFVFPSLSYAQQSSIDLPRLIETFMITPGSAPEWSMGAGESTPQINWESSGIDVRPDCGKYESCRSGTTRVLLNGKELQNLRVRLEPVSWEVFMVSNSPSKFGLEKVIIYPRCDTVQCSFDFKKAMGKKGFVLKQLCNAGPEVYRQTAYEIKRGSKKVYAVIDENLGSGGSSTSITLLFTPPPPPDDFCSEARGEEKDFVGTD